MEDNRNEALTAGNNALAQEHWREAIEIFDELYADEQSLELNYKLVRALFANKQYQLAQQYLAEYLDAYLDDPEYLDILLAVFVQNHNFIEARQLLMSVTDLTVRETGLALVVSGEEKARVDSTETFKVVLRQFIHLGDFEFGEQFNRYRAALKLPLDEYLKGAKFLLRDEYVLPMVRASILESLARLQINDEISFLWFDGEEHSFNPSRTIPALASETAKTVWNVLNETVGQDDPMALQILAEDLKLKLATAFPLLDEIISDPIGWTKYQIARYQDTDLPELAENDIKWIEKLDEILAEVGL
ncbi:tetratricopeptide repeat protein [Periweissella cryptocerci]|nr:tetratricopeptide repeat protein [Periweissella cryptocerci]